jgi:hypothetical protein
MARMTMCICSLNIRPRWRYLNSLTALKEFPHGVLDKGILTLRINTTRAFFGHPRTSPLLAEGHRSLWSSSTLKNNAKTSEHFALNTYPAPA